MSAPAHNIEHPAAYGRLALACAALRRHRVALDALRERAQIEAAEYARAREDMERLVAMLIAQLDEADGDGDLEPSLAGFDERATDDRELEDEDGGAVDDEGEPSLGWTAQEAQTGHYGRTALGEDEPTLGSPCGFQGGTQDWWAGGPTPLNRDDVEEVCEDEGAEHDGREPDMDGAADRDALDLVTEELQAANALRPGFDGVGGDIARRLLRRYGFAESSFNPIRIHLMEAPR